MENHINKNTGGRLNKYIHVIKPNFDKIQEAIKNGTPEHQIYEKLKVSEASWYKHKKEQQEFKDIINSALKNQIENVEGFLYRRCKGYHVEDVKTYIEIDKQGNEKKKIEKNKREIASSDQAISFYLRNKAPDKWKEKQEYQQNINQKIENLTIDIEEEEEMEDIETESSNK